MIYRHSDGYPGKADGSENGVLPDIIPFLSLFQKWWGNDPECLTARLTQHLGNIFTRDEEETKKYGPNFISLGIDMGLHGDEEFIYVINTSKDVWTVEVRETVTGFWDKAILKNTRVIETVKVPVLAKE
jgi:hypothetical protein